MGNESFDECISKLKKIDPDVSVEFNTDKSAVIILQGKLSYPIEVSELEKLPFIQARSFITENKALFCNLDEKTELSNGRVFIDDIGGTHIIFYQKYGDARVMGGTITVHYDKKSVINLIKSDLVYAIDLPKKPDIGPKQATEIAIKDAGGGAEAFSSKKPELLVVDTETANIEKKKFRHYLCWKIAIVYPDRETNPDWIYFVDSLTGDVLFRITAEQTGIGTGFYSYGKDLNSEQSGGTYLLRDIVTSSSWLQNTYVRRPVIHTYNNAGSGNRALRNYSIDSNNKWNNNGEIPENPDNDQRQEVDIHRFLGYAMSYYNNNGQILPGSINGMNNSGGDIEAHAHTGCLLNNASFNLYYERLYFNSGDWVNRRFVSTLDIVGHEFTHGVLFHYGISQFYHGETGAVNEAICDLLGYFIASQHPEDCGPRPWEIGAQSFITGRGRNMKNPSCDESGVCHYDTTSEDTKFTSADNGYYPDHYSIRYRGPNDISHDWGGVHINSTIISHAIYLMMFGGINRTSRVDSYKHWRTRGGKNITLYDHNRPYI